MHSESEAVDLLLEVEKLETIMDFVNQNNYKRICLYLMTSSNYAADSDEMKCILEIAFNIHYLISVLEKHDYPKDDNSYDYLLRLPIYSLTLEKIKELEEQCHKKEKELAFILSKSAEDLWRIDLNGLLKKLT